MRWSIFLLLLWSGAVLLFSCESAGTPADDETCTPGAPGCRPRLGPPDDPDLTYGSSGRDVVVLPDRSGGPYEDLNLQGGDDELILRDGADIAEAVRGGPGRDVFSWEGARLSADMARLFDPALVLEFEEIRLQPRSGESTVTHEITAEELLTLIAANPDLDRLTLGSGLELVDPGQQLDLTDFTGRVTFSESYTAIPVRFGSEGSFYEFRNLNREGSLVRLSGDVRIDSAAGGYIDGGAGDSDLLVWDGGRIGALEAAVDPAALRNFEHLQLEGGTPGAPLSLDAGQMILTLDTEANNIITIDPYAILTGSEADTGGGDDTFIALNNSRIEATIRMGAGNDSFTAARDARITGDWHGGADNDRYIVNTGSLVIRTPQGLASTHLPTLDGGAGTDTLEWYGGALGKEPNDRRDASLGDVPTPAKFENLLINFFNGHADFPLARLADLFTAGGANELTILNTIFTEPGDSLQLGAGNDRITLRSVRLTGQSLQGNGGNDTFSLANVSFTAGSQSRFIDGGAGRDTVILAARLPRALCNAIAGIEVFRLSTNGAETSFCPASARSLSLQNADGAGQVVTVQLEPGGAFGAADAEIAFKVGQTRADRLRIVGDTADGLSLVVRRQFNPGKTDLSVAGALSVQGRMGHIRTDGTAGLACSGGAGDHLCNLLLYDRAVPTAFALSSALQQLSAVGEDDLQPAQRKAVSGRPLTQDWSEYGRMQWARQSLIRTAGRLSGSELALLHASERFSLHHRLRALHLNLLTQTQDERGAHPIDGRLTGVDNRLSALWRYSRTRLAATVAAGAYRSDSLSVHAQPLPASVAASVRTFSLAARRDWTDTGLLSLHGRLNWSDNRLRLDGLDSLQLAAWQSGLTHGRLGLLGQVSGRSASFSWSADYVRLYGQQQVQVLNTLSADRISGRRPTKRLEWNLLLDARLGERSRIGFSLQRQDYPDAASLSEKIAPYDYSARLMLRSYF